MPNHRRRAALAGVFAFAVGFMLVGVQGRLAYGETPSTIEPADGCSSGVKCGDSCCNNTTDKCCKGSCIGERDTCM